MSKFNQRIHEIKVNNYFTPPVNEPKFDNPYLLLSDTQALNDILSHIQTPMPAPEPAEATGLVPTGVTPSSNVDDALISGSPEERHQDESGAHNPGNGQVLPSSGGANIIPDDEESGEENLPTNPQEGEDYPISDDEGHSQITTTQRVTSNGSVAHTGSGLLVNGSINSSVGLPANLNSSLATQNGETVRKILYNPTSNKFTLYYGTRLSSGNYPIKNEITPPTPPPGRQSLLDRIAGAVGPGGGTNYMLDRLNSRSRPGDP